MAMIDIDSIKDVTWHKLDENGFRLTGLPWYEKEKKLSRLPTESGLDFREDLVSLAKGMTGVQLAFKSDTKCIYLKVQVGDVSPVEHMPITATTGFDLYLGEPGKQTFYLCCRWGTEESSYCCHLFDHKEREMRSFLLNFPLLKELVSVEIGLTRGAEIAPPPAYSRAGKIVFYGTSITHGLCVSRSGLIYPNQISRRLNQELVNISFSGNARGDLSVAEALADINDVSIFILDYEANCENETYLDTIPPIIKKLRERHPYIPILLLSRPPFATELHQQSAQDERLVLVEKQRVYIENEKATDINLHFRSWHELLGDDFHEYTVDSVHPNSLGATKMAEALFPVIEDIM